MKMKLLISPHIKIYPMREQALTSKYEQMKIPTASSAVTYVYTKAHISTLKHIYLH